MTVKYLLRYKSNHITSTVFKYQMARALNVHRFPSPSVLVRPYSRRTTKDSAFKHTGECESYAYTEEDLNSELADKVREIETQAKLSKKRVIKKPRAKRERQPKMLTYCEEQYIKSLHESSPDEWNHITLSNCFPALPYMIKNILKSKLKPENVEMVRQMNEIVLANWEKLRRNELECSPIYLTHLKKFINKSDVLQLQMNNPKFSYLPQSNNSPEDKTGVFSSLIDHYEKSLNVATEKMVKFHLKDNFSKKSLSLEGGVNTSDLTVGNNIGNDQSLKESDNATNLIVNNDIANDVSLRADNTTELKAMIKQKHLIPEYCESRGKWKLLTLDELKESVFRKAEKHSLTETDKQIIDRALTKHYLTLFRTQKKVAADSEYVKSQTNEEAPFESIEMKQINSYENLEETENVYNHQKKSEDDNFIFEKNAPDHQIMFQPLQGDNISSAKKSNEFSKEKQMMGDSVNSRRMDGISETAPPIWIEMQKRISDDNTQEKIDSFPQQEKSEDDNFIFEKNAPDHQIMFQPLQVDGISSAKKSNEFSEEKMVGGSVNSRRMGGISEKTDHIETKPRNIYENMEETENVYNYQKKSEDKKLASEGEIPYIPHLFQPSDINNISSAKKSNVFSEKQKPVGGSMKSGVARSGVVNEISEKAPSESIETKPRNSYENMEGTENVSSHQKKSEDDESICEGDASDYPYLFSSSQLNYILNRTQSNESSEEEITTGAVKKTKVPVPYYGTEKDKEVYKKLEEEISKTCFWKSGETDRSFYKSSSVNTHRNDSFISYQPKYSYPKKIEIPKELVEKDKIYKFNDCYYDHNGNFLYRVPGMT